MVPRVGQRIGPYEILGRLGSGGMGLVFSAWDARLQRDVAIKLLREEFATPNMRSRFLQEARAASGLNHPNICTIFDIGEVSGDPFLVMELLKGETLRSRITEAQSLAPEEIHRVAVEVADALGVAHARGIIHRDIKPANIILVDKPGGRFQAKVLDFGLAKVEMAEEESARYDLTSVGTTVGTVSYMSPEQARGETIDARSDLFSLGTVLYEASCGELPFQGATSALIFVELLGKTPASVRSLNPAIPKELDRVIMKLLAKDRGERFQSAASVVEALHGFSPRKAPRGAISRWSGRSSTVRSRLDPPSSFGGAESARLDPSQRARTADPPPARSDSSSILRPVRRVPGDSSLPRSGSSAAPQASTSPERLALTQERSSPVPEPAAEPRPASSAPAQSTAVTLRPVKPESRSASPPGELRAAGNAGAAHSSSSEAAAPTATPAPATPRPRSAPEVERAAVLAGSAFAGEARTLPDSGRAQPATEATRTPSARSQPRTSASGSRQSALAAAALDEEQAGSRSRWILPGVALLAAVGALTWYLLARRPAAVVATGPSTILLASMQDHTGDSSLGGVLATGLRFDLEQSTQLAVRNGNDYLSGLRLTGHNGSNEVSIDEARDAARAVGASVLIFGDIRRSAEGYTLALRVYGVSGATKNGEVSEVAASRDQIPDGIDRVSSDLRSYLGESAEAIARSSIPLSKNATASPDALGVFASADTLAAAGNFAEATAGFQRAVRVAPRFTQAYIRLADLYRKQHAEVAASRAASSAQAGSADAAQRTVLLARASYSIHTLGDYAAATTALNQLLASYAADVETLNQLALAQRLAGRFADAQATAERTLKLSPHDSDAAALDEQALLAQERPEAAAQVEAQSQAAGTGHPGMAALITASLSSTATPADALLTPNGRMAPADVAASLLDASGHLQAGADRWKAIAQSAHDSPELASTAAYAYAAAALDQALAANCAEAGDLAREALTFPAGPQATFNTGIAQALCGNLEGANRSLATLTASFGRAFAAQAYLGPDLTAAIALKKGDTATGLRTLDAARQYDTMSLTPYLRGLVQLSAHQPQMAIVQFQAVLSHHGATLLSNPETYSLAQFGLGRAYAAEGDPGNSSTAYSRFLKLWATADHNSTYLAEAKAHSGS